MTDPELPPALAALERRLADRPGVEPSPDFGPRVLAASRAVLERRPAAMWRRWVGAAAAIAIGVNLSMSVAADADWQLWPGAEPGQIAAPADQLRALAPDLSESEFRRLAFLARAGARLPPAVSVEPRWERRRTTKESERWDER